MSRTRESNRWRSCRRRRERRQITAGAGDCDFTVHYTFYFDLKTYSANIIWGKPKKGRSYRVSSNVHRIKERFSTTTQPNVTKVAFDTKMTLQTTPPHHTTPLTHTNSICGTNLSHFNSWLGLAGQQFV